MNKVLDINGNELKVGDTVYETWEWSPCYGTPHKIVSIESESKVRYDRMHGQNFVSTVADKLEKAETFELAHGVKLLIRSINQELNHGKERK